MHKNYTRLFSTVLMSAALMACSTTDSNELTPEETHVPQRISATGSTHVSSTEVKVYGGNSNKLPHNVPIERRVMNPVKQLVATQTPADIVGKWQGELSMVDHAHPLFINVKRGSDGGITSTFNFFGMDTNNLSVTEGDDKTFDLKTATVSFFLPHNGLKYHGKFISSNSIEGVVDWMGVKQPMTFSKVTETAKELSSHSTHKKIPLNIAILLFDGVDVLDWAGPLEVFQNAHAFNTFTVAANMKAYNGGGYRVFPNYTFDDMPDVDILVVPGGAVGKLFHQENVMSWIRKTSTSADITMSVCNAATLLGRLDILTGLDATTHMSWMKWLTLQSTQHEFNIVDNQRFVDNGKIITTAGVSSGIDGALHLVARLKGIKHAEMTAKMIEYNWSPVNPEQYQ